jgi:hypothetical protein
MASREVERILQSALLTLALAVLLLLGSARAQQTVFNVPSGDVLDKGKTYGELDFAYRNSDGAASFTPRVVVGIGGRVEVGLNLSGFNVPADVQTTLSPAIKWKAYDGGSNGWACLLGDDLFVPVQNKTYNAGNYFYAEVTKTWSTKTRATVGAFHFTRDVVASGQRAGGQFAIEQPIGPRVTMAADWYTGNQSLGFVTPGIVVKLTPKLTWYGSCQIGNRDASSGNHQFLTEFGWSFN